MAVSEALPSGPQRYVSSETARTGHVPKLLTVVSSLQEVRIQTDRFAKVVQRLIALALVPGRTLRLKALTAFRMFVSKRSRRNTTGGGEANDVRGLNSPAVVI